MADFPKLDWEKALVQGLIDKGNDNALLEGDGAREKAMANLAEPIAEAIKHGGGSIHWVANLTVAELNALQSPELDGIYGVKDSGVLVNKDGSRIPVGPNDAVIWNGEKWGSFIDIDLSEYAKKTELAAHANARNNPHQVTAAQVGAYSKDEVDQHIASAVSGVGTFLGSLSPTEIDSIDNPRVGDYADVTDAGYLNGGTTSVIRGDCVVYDGREWVKRLNDGKGLFVVDGQLRFG